MSEKFWNFVNKNDRGELWLYGEISETTWFGDEVTPQTFTEDMKAIGDVKDLDVYIFSPGGDVFAGFAIYSILNRFEGNITVHVDGLAASIATVIAMAGDKIIIPENASFMIHNAWTIAGGNKNDLREMADQLEMIDGQIADIYAARTGKDRDEIVSLMDAETWMTGAEAVENGFADELIENKKIAAKVNIALLGKYKAAPDVSNLFADVEEENSEPLADIDSEINIEEEATEPQISAAIAEQRKMFAETKKKLYEVLSK